RDEQCQRLAPLLFRHGLLEADVERFRQVAQPPVEVVAVLRAKGREVRLPGVPGKLDERTHTGLRLPKAPASPPELFTKSSGQAGAPCKLGQFKRGSCVSERFGQRLQGLLFLPPPDDDVQVI